VDIQNFVPAGGGSFRDFHMPAASEPVATFTPTRTVHRDETWHPYSSELEQGHSRSQVSSAGDQEESMQQGGTTASWTVAALQLLRRVA
jgi:hypothetical protein